NLVIIHNRLAYFVHFHQIYIYPSPPEKLACLIRFRRPE
ncbi:unnamed protein product, partial [Brassica rapa]